MIPIPFYLTFFFGVSRLCWYVADMKTGGMAWFQDLSAPDAYGRLPILSGLVTCLSFEVRSFRDDSLHDRQLIACLTDSGTPSRSTTACDIEVGDACPSRNDSVFHMEFCTGSLSLSSSPTCFYVHIDPRLLPTHTGYSRLLGNHGLLLCSPRLSLQQSPHTRVLGHSSHSTCLAPNTHRSTQDGVQEAKRPVKKW